MSFFKKVKKYFTDKVFRFNINSILGFYNKTPDEKYIKKMWALKFDMPLDLDEPKTFNEKMQWLKLNDRRQKYTVMADKFSAKEYVSDLIGEKCVAKLYGVWDSFDSIDFNSLPDSFVLKTTHGCGGMYICRDKKFLDRKKAKNALMRNFKRNYYFYRREWPYKNVKPSIIAEELLQDGNNNNLPVYKVFNFSGRPTLIQFIRNDKTKDETIDYYDTQWNHLDLKQNYPNGKEPAPKPVTLKKMLDYSAKFSEGMPFLRTDWYEVNGEVFFSEFTFFSDAGFEKFYPEKWDRELGDLIDLNLAKNDEK